MTRMARSRVLRRNTMDCALLNEMFVNDENKRTSKRAQDLLRDAERELKNSMISATSTSYSSRGSSLLDSSYHLESMDKCMPLNTDVSLRGSSKVVESCNRYMCVSSRPTGCRASAPASAFVQQLRCERTPGLNIRKEFHETFANLIKLGSVDRQDAKVENFMFVYISEYLV